MHLQWSVKHSVMTHIVWHSDTHTLVHSPLPWPGPTLGHTHSSLAESSASPRRRWGAGRPTPGSDSWLDRGAMASGYWDKSIGGIYRDHNLNIEDIAWTGIHCGSQSPGIVHVTDVWRTVKNRNVSWLYLYLAKIKNIIYIELHK